jgi:hypothetical protein
MPGLRVPSIIPISRLGLRWPQCWSRACMQPATRRQPLPVAETTHVSGPGGETAESGLGVKTRRAVKARPAREAAKAGRPGDAMEATGAGAESGEPNEGIAPAVIRPVIVTRRALGIAAAARRDTTVIRVIRGKGVARRADRLGRGWSRSAQYGRGR